MWKALLAECSAAGQHPDASPVRGPAVGVLGVASEGASLGAGPEIRDVAPSHPHKELCRWMVPGETLEHRRLPPYGLPSAPPQHCVYLGNTGQGASLPPPASTPIVFKEA